MGSFRDDFGIIQDDLEAFSYYIDPRGPQRLYKSDKKYLQGNEYKGNDQQD